MGAMNSVDAVLAGAKNQLANANGTTNNIVGNPTASFAPHEFSKASYKMARARKPQLASKIPKLAGVQ